MRYLNILLTVCFATAGSLPGAAAQTIESVSTLQTPAAATSATVVPMLVRYDGMAASGKGKVSANMTFLIFKEEKGGEPLWIETQSVTTDASGRYEIYLGSTYSSGLPPDLFGTGEARWLEVQIAGEAPGPRTLLTSVPYALKAADAATLGGLPASAFALAGAPTAVAGATSNSITSDAASNVTTTGGTSLYLPKFNAASTVIDSEIYDTGTSVGIGVVPNAGVKLDVGGAMIMRGNMTVSRTGNATASKAYPSYGFDFFSNLYNSSTKAGDNPYFQLQSEPTGNNTASPSATFNLLFANNGSAAAETGFYINPNGTIHFAPGQTFASTESSTVAVDGTSSSGSGVQGNSTSSNGVYGQSSSGDGVQGLTAGSSNNTAGILGIAGTGNTSGFTGIAGVWGDASAHVGVFGSSDQYDGVFGDSEDGNGVEGASNNGYGVIGGTNGNDVSGVYGYSNAIGGFGVTGMGGPYGSGGSFAAGPTPQDYSPGNGVEASGGSVSEYYGGSGGMFSGGNASGTGTGGDGIYVTAGINPNNTYANAGVFLGNVTIDGTLNGDNPTVRIDHPLDPANKYLNHASIESSEMVNIYSGNVTTDAQGLATVQLPAWFEAENGDLRYQLTPIGQFAQSMVATELANGKFTIRTDKGNVKVSWQITGVRQDAYARAHPLVVEQEKDDRERGLYRHPELYGQSLDKQIESQRHPRAPQAPRTARQVRPVQPRRDGEGFKTSESSILSRQ